MPLRPIVSEFAQADLERRIAELERTVERLTQAIAVGAGGDITIQGSILTVHVPMARFDAVVQCDSIIANSVVGASYTPGAGNVW